MLHKVRSRAYRVLGRGFRGWGFGARRFSVREVTGLVRGILKISLG